MFQLSIRVAFPLTYSQRSLSGSRFGVGASINLLHLLLSTGIKGHQLLAMRCGAGIFIGVITLIGCFVMMMPMRDRLKSS